MKKKHDLPLTEDMLNELNKTSLSGGYSGSVPPLGSGHTAYDNYAQDPDEFYDMEDVWNNDRYYGQQKYKVNNNIHFVFFFIQVEVYKLSFCCRNA
jgi:hypothetical protein